MRSPNLPSKQLQLHAQTPPSEGGVWLLRTWWASLSRMSGMTSIGPVRCCSYCTPGENWWTMFWKFDTTETSMFTVPPVWYRITPYRRSKSTSLAGVFKLNKRITKCWRWPRDGGGSGIEKGKDPAVSRSDFSTTPDCIKEKYVLCCQLNSNDQMIVQSGIMHDYETVSISQWYKCYSHLRCGFCVACCLSWLEYRF